VEVVAAEAVPVADLVEARVEVDEEEHGKHPLTFDIAHINSGFMQSL
jgi:hypothetical protein